MSSNNNSSSPLSITKTRPTPHSTKKTQKTKQCPQTLTITGSNVKQYATVHGIFTAWRQKQQRHFRQRFQRQFQSISSCKYTEKQWDRRKSSSLAVLCFHLASSSNVPIHINVATARVCPFPLSKWGENRGKNMFAFNGERNLKFELLGLSPNFRPSSPKSALVLLLYILCCLCCQKERGFELENLGWRKRRQKRILLVQSHKKNSNFYSYNSIVSSFEVSA